MKNKLYFFFALMFAVTISKAQTAMQFSGLDCNGNSVDLYADLDAGKAVVLFYYMPSCGSCPPPAQKIQAMANNINATYPGRVKAYAYPYQNSTTCAYSSSWVSSNGLSAIYTPMDSGATQVAYYGGFGMPTVVLVGGADHRVMFSTLSFSTSDTIIMRDSILSLFTTTGIKDLPSAVSAFSVYPNPAADHITINIDLEESSDLLIDVADLGGKQLAVLMNEKQNGQVNKQYSLTELPDGNYFIRLHANGKTVIHRITVTR
jgi:hypothetical protein